MPAAMFCAAAAGVGLAAVGRLVLLGPIQRWKPLRIGSNLLSIIAGIVGACVLVSYIPSMMDKSSDWSILSPRDDRMVDKADRAGFDWLAKQPHAYDGTIMFNPAEGPWLDVRLQRPAGCVPALLLAVGQSWHGHLTGVPLPELRGPGQLQRP